MKGKTMAMALSASPVQEDPKQLRNQLGAAARSVNWSYAIFWSISSTHQGVLTWKDGFYNGDVKTRKVTNSTSEMTTDQLVLQRSEQLRELYESMQLSGSRGGHRARPRPVASLSPEDLANAEWYYMVCMTYAFRPGQGLPGKSLARNEHVWLRNAHLADTNTFPRALLAKGASIQTIVCIPLMGGVLELGTTDSVLEDPSLINRATMPSRELQFPACTEEAPSTTPRSTAETGEEAADIIVFEDINHTAAMEAMIADAEGQELGDVECLSDAELLEKIPNEIDECYSLCEEPDVQPLEVDYWITMDGLLEVPSSSEPVPMAADTDAGDTLSEPADGSRVTSFMAWTRLNPGEVEAAPATGGEPQRLLKKVVAGGSAWAGNDGSGRASTTRTTQESGIKNHHVMSERRRREKLNEMFLILKSLVPSIHKVDKASILAETITYLKELEHRVQELECSRELIISPPAAETARGGLGRHGNEIAGVKNVSGTKRKADSELDAGDDVQKGQHLVLSKDDGTSSVSITVADKEVLVNVRCRWKELLVARVFDAVKSLNLDVLSVQASTLNCVSGPKIRAQFASSAALAPGMISEALQEAISNKR